MQLSKSSYMNYLRHPAWLWLEKHDKKKLPKHDKNTQATFAAGFLFETYAEKEFPDARRLGFTTYDEYKNLANITALAVQNQSGPRTIIQAKFDTDDIACICDVVHFDGNLVDIYEIKSSTSVKPEHILDLAFQAEVLRRNGYEVRSLTVLFVNNVYVRRGHIDRTQLIARQDVTVEVLEIEVLTNSQINDALIVMRSEQRPDISPSYAGLGSLANWMKIYRNLVHIPEYSIYDVMSIDSHTIQALESLGVTTIVDIPADFVLSVRQNKQVLATKQNKPIIDSSAIKDFIEKLTYPIYFLDYETFSSVIPHFDGQQPYQQIPFQYSLHILDTPGAKTWHTEYLHTLPSDPINPLSNMLQSHIGEVGSVITWNMSFEKTCNTRMGQLHPEFAEFYKRLNERIVDLATPFATDMYVDKRLLGSYSIKNILPVLAPELSYNTLRIQEGGAAQRLWTEAILDQKNNDGKQQILDDLLDYCEMETRAMVEIFNALKKI